MFGMKILTGLATGGGGGSSKSKVTGPSDAELLTQRQWNEYQRYNAPLTAKLQEASNDTSIVDSALKRADGLQQTNQQQIDRVTGRRVSGMSPAQRRAIRDRLVTTSASDGASSIYTARLAQKDVNNSAVNSIMDIATTMDNQALAALTSSDSLKSSREAQNAANARAARGGFMSTVGSLVGAGVGFFAGGGPAGAALGASIGGSAGSMLG